MVLNLNLIVFRYLMAIQFAKTKLHKNITLRNVSCFGDNQRDRQMKKWLVPLLVHYISPG